VDGAARREAQTRSEQDGEEDRRPHAEIEGCAE
jgi:hypothetical protein